MSKEFKVKAVELAELAMDEMDKLPNPETRKMFVGWLMNFWGNATPDLASYAIASGDIEKPAKEGMRRRFQVAKEAAKK